jgi:flagellar biosynthesis protein FliR
MQNELTLPVGTLLGFALVLFRIGGVFVFVPLPSQESGPSPARVALALAATIALFPRWPMVDPSHFELSTMVLWMFSELALGICIGLAVSFIAEAIVFGAQALGLQAGYGYASVVDPTTQADSNVLPVLANLCAGLLFFTTGLHRLVISAFVASLDSFPPGNFTIPRELAQAVIHLGSNIFTVGFRLALPIVGLLLMTDIALALLGRMNSQLQLGMHAFPAKMLLTLSMLAVVLIVAPNLYSAYAGEVFRTLHVSLRR